MEIKLNKKEIDEAIKLYLKQEKKLNFSSAIIDHGTRGRFINAKVYLYNNGKLI